MWNCTRAVVNVAWLKNTKQRTLPGLATDLEIGLSMIHKRLSHCTMSSTCSEDSHMGWNVRVFTNLLSSQATRPLSSITSDAVAYPNLKKKKTHKDAFRLIPQGFSLVSEALSVQRYFYYSLDGILVHRRVTPSSNFDNIHLYTWVERGTVRVKCLAQEHSTMSITSAWIQSVWSTSTIKSPSPPPLQWFIKTVLHTVSVYNINNSYLVTFLRLVSYTWVHQVVGLSLFSSVLS